MELTAGQLACAMPPLANIDHRKLDFEMMDASIRRLSGPLEILEAGCGRSWPLELAGIDYRLTGIDLDAEALRLRVKSVGDLHEAIVGDLCAPGAIPAATSMWCTARSCSSTSRPPNRLSKQWSTD
jgi:hypothetical protein